jgi:protocatechuate 3,4-dioxygenase beta subunit
LRAFILAALTAGLLSPQVALQRGVISGVVLKAGMNTEQPLQNARLELSGGPPPVSVEIGGGLAGAPRVIRTGADGRFAFNGLAAGRYRLAATSDGFVRQKSPAPIVISAEKSAVNVRFELDPAATAAGWVLDAYGEPIPNVVVEALRRIYDARGRARFSRAASAITDDRGQYRIFWLDPGDYFFYASSSPPDTQVDTTIVRVFTTTYFPGVNTPEDAKSVHLDIGREVRVDFRLRRAALWKVSGQTANGATGRPLAASVTAAPPALEPGISRYAAETRVAASNAGYFELPNVTPGSYIVTARSGSGESEMFALERIELRPLSFAPPPTRPPSFPLVLNLVPPRGIQGRLYVDGGAAELRPVRVALLPSEPELPLPVPDSPGVEQQFTLNGTFPGSYVLNVSELPEDYYVKAARFGDADILEKPLVVDARETPAAVQILLGTDGSRLDVKVFNRDNQLQPGAGVVVIPDAPRRHRRELYRVGLTDDDGRTALRGIAPGDYRVFAWSALEPNAYLNDEYMRPYESFGVPLRFASGQHAEVAVRVIPKE